MDLYRSTYERRRLLDHHYLFECLCTRCSRPSQGRKTRDSVIDGIICPVAGCGAVIQWSQTDEDSDEIVWKCTDSSCSGQREHEDVLSLMMELEQLYTQQLDSAERYQSAQNTQLLDLCHEMSRKADGFLHQHHRFLVLTYAHLAQFEPSNRQISQHNILKHLDAVRSILGDPHPAIIDDYIFLAMLNSELDLPVGQQRPWLDEARKRYDTMFGHEGRPFDHHVAGLRRSVSAPRSCINK